MKTNQTILAALNLILIAEGANAPLILRSELKEHIGVFQLDSHGSIIEAEQNLYKQFIGNIPTGARSVFAQQFLFVVCFWYFPVEKSELLTKLHSIVDKPKARRQANHFLSTVETFLHENTLTATQRDQLEEQHDRLKTKFEKILN